MGNFRDNEQLTDNLDDEQARRLLTVLEFVEIRNPSDLDLLLCLVGIINEVSKSDQGVLFENLIHKLEEKYVEAKK